MGEISSAQNGEHFSDRTVTLDLDSGYLSRLLRTLERDGLVEVRTDPSDKRVRTVQLAPLDETQRTRLVEAMAVERLIAAGGIEVGIVDPAGADAQFCIRSYFAELDARFEAGFDPDHSLPTDTASLTEPAGLLLVARLHGEPVGCGGLKLHGGDPAEVKRMWVAPAARGLGVARRILRELEDHALRRGVTVLQLETNRALHEAIALYRSAGYVEIEAFNEEPYGDHWFEKRVAED